MSLTTAHGVCPENPELPFSSSRSKDDAHASLAGNGDMCLLSFSASDVSAGGPRASTVRSRSCGIWLARSTRSVRSMTRASGSATID